MRRRGTPSCTSARGSARNDELGLENLDNLTTLAERATDYDRNSPIGLRARRRDLDHLTFHVRHIARARRGGPVELSFANFMGFVKLAAIAIWLT